MNDRLPGSSWTNPIKYRGFLIGPNEDAIETPNPRIFQAVQDAKVMKPVIYEAASIELLKKDIDKHYALINETINETRRFEAIIRPFGVPPEDFERIKEAAMIAWEKYGTDDQAVVDLIRRNGMWNDHIAIQAGIEVYKLFKGFSPK